MDPQILSDEEIKTTWNRAGAGAVTMHADPDTKDADGTDGDTTDTVDGDADGTDGDTTDKVDGDADGTDGDTTDKVDGDADGTDS